MRIPILLLILFNREGAINIIEKKKTTPHYGFLFHNVWYLTKVVKPNEKYKIVLSITLRPSIKVVREEGEQENRMSFNTIIKL